MPCERPRLVNRSATDREDAPAYNGVLSAPSLRSRSQVAEMLHVRHRARCLQSRCCPSVAACSASFPGSSSRYLQRMTATNPSRRGRRCSSSCSSHSLFLIQHLTMAAIWRGRRAAIDRVEGLHGTGGALDVDGGIHRNGRVRSLSTARAARRRGHQLARSPGFITSWRSPIAGRERYSLS